MDFGVLRRERVVVPRGQAHAPGVGALGAGAVVEVDGGEAVVGEGGWCGVRLRLRGVGVLGVGWDGVLELRGHHWVLHGGEAVGGLGLWGAEERLGLELGLPL